VQIGELTVQKLRVSELIVSDSLRLPPDAALEAAADERRT
jgi:hypothetical protein